MKAHKSALKHGISETAAAVARVLLCGGLGRECGGGGIEISQKDLDVEGDLDVRSFPGLPGPMAGFTEIRVTVQIASSNAARDQLDELRGHVESISPVGDCLMNPVSVIASLEVS